MWICTNWKTVIMCIQNKVQDLESGGLDLIWAKNTNICCQNSLFSCVNVYYFKKFVGFTLEQAWPDLALVDSNCLKQQASSLSKLVDLRWTSERVKQVHVKKGPRFYIYTLRKKANKDNWWEKLKFLRKIARGPVGRRDGGWKSLSVIRILLLS